MIAKQRGEGAHLLDALWFRMSGDVGNLRRLHLHCRNIGHKIVEHEISEMIEYLEESETKKRQVLEGINSKDLILNQGSDAYLKTYSKSKRRIRNIWQST